jgi:maltose phosphorylase
MLKTASRMGSPLSMVTMNGENVITNGKLPTKKFTGAIAFAIFNYHRFTGDYSYIPEKLEVLLGLPFWHQNQLLSKDKINMLFLGLRDPMNTKTISTIISIPTILQNGVLIIPMSKFRKYRWNTSDHKRIIEKVKLADAELQGGKK